MWWTITKKWIIVKKRKKENSYLVFKEEKPFMHLYSVPQQLGNGNIYPFIFAKLAKAQSGCMKNVYKALFLNLVIDSQMDLGLNLI